MNSAVFPPTNKKTIRSQKTREFLLNAALEVFYRDGVTKSSLENIAKEAGVTRGAFYWHFDNKEDLFDALFQRFSHHFLVHFDENTLCQHDNILQYLQDNLLMMLRSLVDDEPYRKFCGILYNKCEQTVGNFSITELAKQHHHGLLNRIAKALQLCVQKGQLPADLDLPVAQLYLESQIVGLVKTWLDDPNRFDLEKMAKPIIEASVYVLRHNSAVLKG